MTIVEANNILRMFNIQAKRDDNRWYVASLTATVNGETLWGHLGIKGSSTEEMCEYVLSHIDAIRRFNGEN